MKVLKRFKNVHKNLHPECFLSDLERVIPRTCSTTTLHRENKTKQECGFELLHFLKLRYVKSARYWSFSSLNAGNKDRKNSEYGQFLRSDKNTEPQVNFLDSW